MTDQNKPMETELISLRDKQELQRVRAVHAVLMRWVIEGLTVEEILAENPGSLQEFVARRRIEDIFHSKPGTQVSIKATDRLIELIDGKEEDGKSTSPVTLIERHIEGPEGEVTKVREVRQHGVQLVPVKGDDDERRE